MARQTYYITREQRNPLYRTRMLQAGPIVLDAGAARLYRKLGVDMSDEKPKKLKGTGGLHEALTGESPTELTGLAAALKGPDTEPAKAAPKVAPKKRATRKRKTAKR